MAEMARISLHRMGMQKRIVGVPLWLCWVLATLKQILIPGSVSARQALAGFRYDASPDIAESEKDLDYRPGTPF